MIGLAAECPLMPALTVMTAITANSKPSDPQYYVQLHTYTHSHTNKSSSAAPPPHNTQMENVLYKHTHQRTQFEKCAVV